MTIDDASETARLEQLWGGEFGDEYVERNAGAYERRESFWTNLREIVPIESALEVGCNIGGNLQWLAPVLAPGATWGVDVNRKAIEVLHERLPTVNAVWGPARQLPFRDQWFDLVFTMGVLIHQPDEALPAVMREMVRCSRRFVLCGEYYADTQVEVSYHGHDGALFKRDYGALFRALEPSLSLVGEGFLGRDEGWDDVTWWLFERP